MAKDIVYQVGGKEQRITASGTETTLFEGIRQLQERIDSEKRAISSTELTLDGSNEVSFPGFPYFFEALGEKILVSIDVFKSGYECKSCKGVKTIKYMCICEKGRHPGLRYSQADLDAIRETLGEDVAMSRESLPCQDCMGDFEKVRAEKPCEECKGLGVLLHIPDTSKNLPTTGVVVSMGTACDKDKLKFKIGDRILFGPYAGNMIPTKAGLMFKIMDATQAWCKIRGGEDLAAFDFIIQEKE